MKIVDTILRIIIIAVIAYLAIIALLVGAASRVEEERDMRVTPYDLRCPPRC